MASIDPRIFSVFALKFKNHDPKLYEKFLRVMDEYTHEITVAVTEADPNSILMLQGRAQQARKFMQVMSEFRTEDNKSVA
jgi:hypothetical protein